MSFVDKDLLRMFKLLDIYNIFTIVTCS